MRKTYPFKTLLSIAMFGSALPVISSAQTAPAEEAETYSIPEIVVTARRRDENLQQVPLSVTAISSSVIENANVTSFKDIATIPNVMLASNIGFAATQNLFIRGIGFQDVDLSFEPGVGVTLDGVFLSKPLLSNVDMFDVEQMEVLRGPQGTLFGKNTIGGIINIRTKRPTGEFGGSAQFTVGNYDRIDIRASVEAPLVKDKLAARVSVFSANSDNYTFNRLTNNRPEGDDLLSGRATFLFTPTDSFDFTLIVDGSRNRGGLTLTNNASPSTFFAPLIGFPGDTDGDLHKTSVNDPNTQAIDVWGIMGEVNWRLPNFVLTSITAYRTLDEESLLDADGAPASLAYFPRTAEIRQFSQEVRLASDFDGSRFDFVIGTLFLKSDYDQVQDIFLRCQLILPFPCGAIGLTDATLLNVGTVQSQDSDNWGFFAQGNYRVTDKLRVTLGGRYSHEKKDFTLTPGAPFGGAVTGSAKKSFKNFSPRVGLDYQFTDDAMAYATFTSGFKSGGFNGRAAVLSRIGPYGSEKVNSYEVGAKTQWLDDRLRLNVALFFNQYKDLQLDVLQNTATGTETLVSNAADAETKGVEIEFVGRPAHGLTLKASGGYLDSKFKDFIANIDGTGVRDWSFLKLRRAPKWTVTGGFEYETPLSSWGQLFLGADVNHVSSFFTTADNFFVGQSDGWTTIDARIGVESDSGAYRITLWGRNLNDDVAVAAGTNLPPLFAIQTGTAPRTYGVDFTVRF
jgi:iron complex outermembrane recepter protein